MFSLPRVNARAHHHTHMWRSHTEHSLPPYVYRSLRTRKQRYSNCIDKNAIPRAFYIYVERTQHVVCCKYMFFEWIYFNLKNTRVALWIFFLFIIYLKLLVVQNRYCCWCGVPVQRPLDSIWCSCTWLHVKLINFKHITHTTPHYTHFILLFFDIVDAIPPVASSSLRSRHYRSAEQRTMALAYFFLCFVAHFF